MSPVKNNIFWLEELNKDSSLIVGKKCANLGELTRAGFQVPRGFALSVDMYERFIKNSGAFHEIAHYLKDFNASHDVLSDIAKYNEASEVIRSIVEAKRMPKNMENAVGRYYEEICINAGTSDIPVAVRSAGPLSHPGQYETYLHVRGKDELMQNIIKVWSSTFNARSILAREKAGLSRNFDPIGVAVLQMVNAKAAGVIFTLNPLNGDRSKIIIEGNWGLGESVVSGSVTPDEWVVDKVVLEIIRRKISAKQIEYIIDQETKKVKAVDIPSERQTIPCLSDEEIIELARKSKAIERHYGMPQDIEWVIDKELPFPKNIFFVQTRPETVWSSKKKESVLKTTGNATSDVINFYRNLKA